MISSSGKFKKERKRTTEKEFSKEEVEEKFTKEELSQIKRDYYATIADIPEAELTDISANIAGPEYIEKNTVVEINKTLSQTKGSEGGGSYSRTVMDPLMSPTPQARLCYTCNFDIDTCIGHFGRIRLAAMQYYASFIKYIISILYCVCRSCAQLKLTEEQLDKMGLLRYQELTRLKHMADILKNVKCMNKNCKSTAFAGEIASKKSEQNGKIMLKKVGTNQGNEIPIESVYQILSKISINDYRTMGFPIKTKGDKVIGTHPKNFILQMIMVRPPRDRRDFFVNGEWKVHDQTKVYNKMVEVNNRLKANLEKLTENLTQKKRDTVQSSIDSDKDELFRLIASLVDSEKYQLKIYGVSQLKGLKQEVTGKDKLIRQNMQSRRVNNVTRSVVTPDPTLEVGQMAISEDVADEQSFPEEVNWTNIIFLTNLMRKGGVKSIMPTAGPDKNRIIEINPENRNSIDLQVGTIVHRKILNGDYIVSNRNPSIHMYSMMGGTAIRRPQKTISPHMAQTTPGQIDFDGDEMQIHFVQTIGAAADIKELMELSNIMMNVQSNRPLIGAVYDIPLGLYLLTRPGGKLTKSSYWNAIAFLKNTDQLPSLISRAERHHLPITVPRGPYDHEEMYNGRLLFSALLPADFYYNGHGITIVEGILLDGILGKPDKNGVVTKDSVGTSHNSIIQVMWAEKGPLRTKNFLTDLYLTVNSIYTEIGMTLGFEDVEITDPKILLQIERATEDLITKYEELEIPSDLDKAAKDKYEREVMSLITGYGNLSAKIIEGIKNNLTEIAASKTKGGMKNLVAIMDKVGQQTLQGERLVPRLREGKVCFNYFDPEDRSLESRGFCDRSYSQGLTLQQYQMHAAASREQLVNVSVSTRFVGYDHRSLVKFSEDVITTEDCSVRNKGVVIQGSFGGHSLDPTQLFVLNTKWGKMPEPLDLDTLNNKFNNLFHVEGD